MFINQNLRNITLNQKFRETANITAIIPQVAMKLLGHEYNNMIGT
jgi:hypothetical protein